MIAVSTTCNVAKINLRGGILRDPRKMLCGKYEKRRRSRQGSGFDSQGCYGGTAFHSLAVRSRSEGPPQSIPLYKVERDFPLGQLRAASLGNSDHRAFLLSH
ncbi:hypothetical protein PUN28_002696 [Cardiocondyla obscurior]|uniref:Uncharacterized protein n=1 Tax=Cardiocondyla obscurior TaxID=286306 RepID=A0AAW2GVR6_9HYME